METDGNEIADELARQGSSHTLIAPKPGLDISAKVAKGVIMDWMSRKIEEHWQSTCRHRQVKSFLKKSPLQKTLGNCSS
jgi:hypothetical protein